MSRRLREYHLLREQRPKRLGLEQAPPRSGVRQAELLEDRPRVGAPAAAPPLVREARPQLRVAVGRLEDPPDDELRRHRAVPLVLLQPERDVPERIAAVAVEAAAEAEGDRAAGVSAAVLDAKTQVLAVADGRRLGDLAPGDEQRHVGVAEPERREPPQLAAEPERQRA